jgi:LuxR family transcriptional regulator, maltose regulon positive regulatory protein
MTFVISPSEDRRRRPEDHPDLGAPGRRLRRSHRRKPGARLRREVRAVPLRDIGNELYASLHTIKSRTKPIYGKLGAHRRAEAVERARALGLVAPSMHKR